MEGLFLSQFEQCLADDLLVINLVNPEFAVFAGVSGDALAVLAGDGYFHSSLCSFCRAHSLASCHMPLSMANSTAMLKPNIQMKYHIIFSFLKIRKVTAQ